LPVNYNVSTRNNRLQQVANAIDAASPPGNLNLLDGGGNVLAVFQLQQPVGTISGGVLTFSGLSLICPAASQTGTALFANCTDGNGTIVISGLVVNGNLPDILLTPTQTITAGQTVAITAATITGN
jgi:hypothetical protein